MHRSEYRPDCGYGWAVVGACFVINVITAGLARSAGVLYIALVDTFNVSKEAASTPFTIRFCVRSMSGPIVGALGQRFGTRPVTFFGGIAGFIGGMICAMAPDVTWINFGFGGFLGLSYGLSNIIHVLMITRYFDKRKGIALGIAQCGDCFGSFLLPPVLELLLSTYDLRGTFFILAAISLHMVPAAMLMVPPVWERPFVPKGDREKRQSTAGESRPSKKGVSNLAFEDGENLKCGDNVKEVTSDSKKLKLSASIVGEYCCESISYSSQKSCCEQAKTINSFHCEELSEAFEKNYQNGALSLEQHTTGPMTIQDSCTFQGDNSTFVSFIGTHNHQGLCASFKGSATTDPVKDGCASLKMSANEMGVDNLQSCYVNYSQQCVYDNILKTDRQSDSDSSYYANKSDNLTLQFPNTDISIKDKFGELPSHRSSIDSRRSNLLLKFLRTTTKPMFLLISVTMAAYCLLFVVAFTVIIDYAIDSNIPQENGKFLIIAFSLADTFGKLGFGVVLDRHWFAIAHFAGLTTVLVGLLIFVMPFWTSFIAWMILFGMSGFVQGGCSIMYPILVQHYMERDEESVALGSMNLYAGLIMMPVPLMIGFFRDTVGSYDGTFWTAGGICIVTGFLWLLEPCLLALNCSRKVSKKNDLGISEK